MFDVRRSTLDVRCWMFDVLCCHPEGRTLNTQRPTSNVQRPTAVRHPPAVVPDVVIGGQRISVTGNCPAPVCSRMLFACGSVTSSVTDWFDPDDSPDDWYDSPAANCGRERESR